MERNEISTGRRDLLLSSGLTTAGLVAVLIARGGVGVMIAGSVGAIGASVAAVFVMAMDERLTYLDKVKTAIPMAFLMLLVSLVIRDNAFAFVGYPILAVGLAGIVPALRQIDRAPMAQPIPRAVPAASVERSPDAAEAHVAS